jgi:hypothetical protein
MLPARAAALPAGIVICVLTFGKLDRIGGALLIAVYGAFLAFTFA